MTQFTLPDTTQRGTVLSCLAGGDVNWALRVYAYAEITLRLVGTLCIYGRLHRLTSLYRTQRLQK